jgi:hypothetical protein
MKQKRKAKKERRMKTASLKRLDNFEREKPTILEISFPVEHVATSPEPIFVRQTDATDASFFTSLSSAAAP